MEHILQFGINIDDAAIINAVKAKAEKEIITKLTNEVGAKIFEGNRWSGGYDANHLSYWSEQLIVKFLDNHKTEIIDAAAKVLADRLVRTKAGKAILENI